MDGVILLADKNSPSWDFAEKIQRYIKEKKEVEVPLEEVSIKHFRNGEINMYVPENVREKDIYFIHDASKNPQEWVVQIILIKDLLRRSSAKKISLVFPARSYERQDFKDKPHVPISARALADIIERGAERLIAMDLHSSQIQGFYTIPVDALSSAPDVIDYLIAKKKTDNLVIVAADVGATKRARNFASKLEKKLTELHLATEIPLAIVEKRRPEQGRAESINLIGDVSGKDVFIYEDIIDSGGTLISAAELLKKSGANSLTCYGTHAFFTENADIKLSKVYDSVMISNTIPYSPKEESKVEIVDVSGTFAEAIYRAQKGLSISKLFE